MGNCLVTKLKAAVNNPDLLTMNELRISFNGVSNVNFGLAIESIAKPVTLKIVSGNITMNGGTADVSITTTGTKQTVINGTGVISIDNKYNLINISTNHGVIDYDDIKYLDILLYLTAKLEGKASASAHLTSLKNISVAPGSTIEGTIYDLMKNFTVGGVTSCAINTPNITGDISTIAKYMNDDVLETSATENVAVLNLASSGVSGSIAGYIASKRTLGQTVGKVSMNYCNGFAIDANKTYIIYTSSASFTWDASGGSVTDGSNTYTIALDGTVTKTN